MSIRRLKKAKPKKKSKDNIEEQFDVMYENAIKEDEDDCDSCDEDQQGEL